MTRIKLLAVALALVALGGVATQGAAVTAPVPAQAGNAGNAGPSGITVVDLAGPESATPGEEVTITATLNNPTDQLRTERLEFRFRGDVFDRTTVALEPGEATTVTVTLDTTDIKPGEYVYAVFTESGGAVDELTLSESFELDSLDAPTNVTVGDNVTVTATVSNPNGFTTTQPVEFRIGGAPLASEDVTLDAGGSTTVSFEFSTEGLDPGGYIHGVFTRDRGAFARLTAEAPAEPTVSVTFEDQTSDGTTVTVADVTLSDDGYVAIHDSSLLDGNVVGSVIGVSEYQEAGTYEDLNVTLFDVPGAEFNETELTENDTLIAMPHEETGNNTTYDFVATGGMEDGPFVADGQPVTDSAAVTVEPGDNMTDPNTTDPNATTEASVTFENQTSDGTTVAVANATLPDDGYVAIHDSSLLDGNVVGSVIGVSEYLENGTYEALNVMLFDVPGAEFNETELTENDTLIAMPHEETGDNTTYDFVRTNGTQDGPFVVDGDVVVDSGLVTVSTVAPPAGNDTTDNGTAGNGTAGNGTAGNGTAGNGTTGSGTAGNGTAGDT